MYLFYGLLIINIEHKGKNIIFLNMETILRVSKEIL